MDALLIGFVATLFAEIGGRVQQCCGAIPPTGRHAVLFVMLTLGVIAAASVGGLLVSPLLNQRAGLMMLGLALASGGIGQVLPLKPATPSLPALALAVIAAPAPFIAFAVTARSDSPGLSAAGAAAGLLVAGLPALLLRAEWERPELFRRLRLGAGLTLCLAALWCLLNAWRLI